MKLKTPGLLFVMAGVASAAPAQTTVDAFSRLPEVVKKGNVVFVQDENGERTKGKISDLTDSRLQIKTPGVIGNTRVFTADQVMRVSKVDSRLNGFLIGLSAGVVPGLLLGHGLNSWCENESGDHCGVMYAYMGGLLGIVGGGIGFAIDGAIDGQTLVFARRSGTARSQLHIGPIAGKGVGGLRLSVQF